MSQASERVLVLAGGAWDASLNHYAAGGKCMVTTQQIDDWVYVVGQDEFRIARYSLGEWNGEVDQPDPPFIECDNAQLAWEVLLALRADCLLWQCEACDGWIFTSSRPRVGRLRCSTCGDGGIDFRHADRALGDIE